MSPQGNASRPSAGASPLFHVPTADRDLSPRPAAGNGGGAPGSASLAKARISAASAGALEQEQPAARGRGGGVEQQLERFLELQRNLLEDQPRVDRDVADPALDAPAGEAAGAPQPQHPPSPGALPAPASPRPLLREAALAAGHKNLREVATQCSEQPAAALRLHAVAAAAPPPDPKPSPPARQTAGLEDAGTKQRALLARIDQGDPAPEEAAVAPAEEEEGFLGPGPQLVIEPALLDRADAAGPAAETATEAEASVNASDAAPAPLSSHAAATGCPGNGDEDVDDAAVSAREPRALSDGAGGTATVDFPRPAAAPERPSDLAAIDTHMHMEASESLPAPLRRRRRLDADATPEFWPPFGHGGPRPAAVAPRAADDVRV